MAESCSVDIYTVTDEPVPENPYPNVRVIPVSSSSASKSWKNRYGTFYKEFSDGLTTRVLESGRRYDVVYAHDLTVAYPARRLKKLFGAKLLYDVHDLAYETVNQNFSPKATFPKSWAYRLMIAEMRFLVRRFERSFFRDVDLCITVNESCKNYLTRYYGHPQTHVVVNYPAYREVTKSRHLYDELDIAPQKRIVLYQGNLNEGRYLREIVKSATYFDDDTVLVIIGTGQLLDELKQSAARSPKQNVYFHTYIPYDRLLEFTSGAALGICALEHINLSKKFASANKITEYFAAGIPALVTDSPEAVRLVDLYDCGYIFSPQNPERFARYISSVWADPERLHQKGINAQTAFREKLNWDKEKHIFDTLFNALLIK